MAAVFPLDTSAPWVFNGVTYKYDATEDRWFVVSTTATDSVVNSLGELENKIDVTNTVIDQEIENRTVLLNAAANKNNTQDASLDELSGRIDAIGSVVGVLEFKGRFQYVLEKTVEACTAAYAQCLVDAGGDVPSMSECNRLKDVCEAAVGDPYPNGTFTSKGTTNVMEDVEEFTFSGIDLDGQSLDWINLVEPTDYIEFVEKTGGDTVLYECIEEPKIYSTERSIRVKFLKQTGSGDGNFNLQEEYDIRVIKASTGIDIVEADKRYVQRPYQVIFSSDTPTEGQAEDKVLRNGELWYDTLNLELFVWNNNSWVTTTKPASQDIVVVDINSQVDALNAKAASLQFEVNTIIQESVRSPHLYYSDDEPIGNAEGNLIDGDLWVDSNDLTIKFYSQGAWINPDRTSTANDYVQKTGDTMTGKLVIESASKDALQVNNKIDAGGSSILWVQNLGQTQFRVRGNGEVQAGTDANHAFMATHDHDVVTKKYADQLVRPPQPGPFSWLWESYSSNSAVSNKHFTWQSGKFLYLSRYTWDGAVLANPSNLPSGATTFASYLHQVGTNPAKHLKMWMLKSDGSWELMAWAVPYRYRFNYGGWVQLEYKSRQGSLPDVADSRWCITLPDLF